MIIMFWYFQFCMLALFAGSKLYSIQLVSVFIMTNNEQYDSELLI